MQTREYKHKLLEACRNNDVSIIKLLIQKSNLSYDAFNIDGKSCLNIACELGNYQTIKLLIDNEPTLINIPDGDNIFPIEWAVENGDINIFDFLIKNGADPYINKDGFNLLHLAAYHGRNKIIDRLLSLKINLNEMDDNGRGRTPLMWVAEAGNLSTLKHLIKLGANAELKDENGMTALDIAVSEGWKVIVKELLNSGVDVNQRTQNNGTVLHTAVAWQKNEIVKLLLEFGADIEIKDNDGKRPFDL